MGNADTWPCFVFFFQVKRPVLQGPTDPRGHPALLAPRAPPAFPASPGFPAPPSWDPPAPPAHRALRDPLGCRAPQVTARPHGRVSLQSLVVFCFVHDIIPPWSHVPVIL